MAHSKSARKRARQNLQRRLRNRRRKAAVKGSIRALDEAIQAGKDKPAAKELQEVYRHLDRSAAKGTLHRNTAARKKSRLARKVNQLR